MEVAESNLSLGLDPLTDLRFKHNKLLSEVHEAHQKQLSILQTAIAEERHDMAQSQKMFEQTLQIKYDHLVAALQDKVKAENDAKMQRALDDLERSARNESERARQTFQAQQAAEAALSVKFKGIVSDLRQSWEEEEIARARQLEERLRAHYSTVLEHMEAQLQMALQLQDEADKQWMEDVEARNKQQVEALKRFEDKCRRLYDTRLKEYCEKSDQQMTQYEDQLLQVGSTLAIERGRVEGRQRRMKLACQRWKVEYQKDVDERYRAMCAALENKYMDEIQALLEENAKLQMGFSATRAERSVTQQGLTPPTEMRLAIQQYAKENNFSSEDVANIFASLIDAAPCGSALMQSEFNKIMSSKSNSSGGPVKSRREAIDHKRNLLKGGGDSSGEVGGGMTNRGPATTHHETPTLPQQHHHTSLFAPTPSSQQPPNKSLRATGGGTAMKLTTAPSKR